jgi:spore coat polysaccharide biosynthesis protein SpsF (cytidylyltransferase family)
VIGAPALIVLQARMASRRLPGKAFALVGGRPILARCLDRLRAGVVGPVVLATTTHPEDDALAALGQAEGVVVVRGSEADVLHRFVVAAARFGATYIVRATADNPAVDIDAPRRVLETLVRTGVDYVIEAGLPYGTAVEGVAVDALEKADLMATEAADREHVTPLIRRDCLFRTIEMLAPSHLRRPDLRLTVDTLHDLAFIRRIMSRLGDPLVEPPLQAIIEAADTLRDVPKAAAR